jgi:hypothetical protein
MNVDYSTEIKKLFVSAKQLLQKSQPNCESLNWIIYRAASFNLQELELIVDKKNIDYDLYTNIIFQIFMDYIKRILPQNYNWYCTVIKYTILTNETIIRFFVEHELDYHLETFTNYVFQPLCKIQISDLRILIDRGVVVIRKTNDTNEPYLYNLSMQTPLYCKQCKKNYVRCYLDCGCVYCMNCTVEILYHRKKCYRCDHKIINS